MQRREKDKFNYNLSNYFLIIDINKFENKSNSNGNFVWNWHKNVIKNKVWLLTWAGWPWHRVESVAHIDVVCEVPVFRAWVYDLPVAFSPTEPRQVVLAPLLVGQRACHGLGRAGQGCLHGELQGLWVCASKAERPSNNSLVTLKLQQHVLSLAYKKQRSHLHTCFGVLLNHVLNLLPMKCLLNLPMFLHLTNQSYILQSYDSLFTFSNTYY